MGLLLRAYCTNNLKVWLGAGIMLGLLTYTYFSARVWLGYAGLMLVYWSIRCPQKRRGVLLTTGTAIVFSLPLFIYMYLNPTASMSRMDEVSVLNLAGLWHNGLAWIGAWFQLGDQNVMLNLPGRPIFDWLWAIPFLVGVVCLLWVVRVRWHGLWILGLAAVCVVPSLFSDHAPHFLRAIGLVIPIALIVGAGLHFLEQLLRRYVGKVSLFLPCLWLLVAAIMVYETMGGQWLTHPDLYDQMEVPINEATRFIQANVSAETPIYFAPMAGEQPTFLFQAAALAPRPVAAFDNHECWVKTAVPTTYVLLDNNGTDNVDNGVAAEILQRGSAPIGAESEGYVILSVPASEENAQDASAVFGEAVQLGSADFLPIPVYAGTVIPLDLDFRALQPVDKEYRLFCNG
jgi:hypothetical protein